jgi:hypothetical protein
MDKADINWGFAMACNTSRLDQTTFDLYNKLTREVRVRTIRINKKTEITGDIVCPISWTVSKMHGPELDFYRSSSLAPTGKFGESSYSTALHHLILTALRP